MKRANQTMQGDLLISEILPKQAVLKTYNQKEHTDELKNNWTLNIFKLVNSPNFKWDKEKQVQIPVISIDKF